MLLNSRITYEISYLESERMGWVQPLSQTLCGPSVQKAKSLGHLHPINSEPEKKVDYNPPGLKPLPTPHGFSSNPPVPDSRSFPKVETCNTGSLGGEISNPVNEKSPELAPSLRFDTCPENMSRTIATNDNLLAPDARSFPEIPTQDTGRPLKE
ncbi:hypothetical protein DSO57_1034369 [Entomophthora muscae]|uniref:Uncharacterized protein n=1 Tax=Entomophthora muscae TaxID=34485 RepID=A0ACC2UKH8_9FUNG|nr:hypothetical protein DSO57_1034369 [Entomophthora muscae]